MTNTKNKNHLSSVRNALRMLKAFSMDEPEKSVSELAETLNINKSTVSRTMATLASEGFVYKDPDTNKYRLGLSIISLSGIINNNTDIFNESQPVLNRLVESCGETAHISVLDNDEIIYLQKVECNHPVRILTHVGKRNPAYCTSSGKVLLAFSDDDIVERVIAKGLKKFTKHTITNPTKLREHLQEIRVKGYAHSLEEFNEGVSSIATPIYDYTGKVVSALSVVAPKQRLNNLKLKDITKKTINASKAISERLGYWR